MQTLLHSLSLHLSVEHHVSAIGKQVSSALPHTYVRIWQNEVWLKFFFGFFFFWRKCLPFSEKVFRINFMSTSNLKSCAQCAALHYIKLRIYLWAASSFGMCVLHRTLQWKLNGNSKFIRCKIRTKKKDGKWERKKSIRTSHQCYENK